MPDGKTEVHFTLSAKERAWLKELAWQSRMSEAGVLRELVRYAAKRAGLPDPDKPSAIADPGDGADRADQLGGQTS